MDDNFALGSNFRVEWLDDGLTRNEREEIERAVALAATNVLRSARFAKTLTGKAGQDLEVRVWLDTDNATQVVVWWEPRMSRFWFPVVDAQDASRLALVVFDRVPSVTLAQMERDEAQFTDALRSLLPEEGAVRLSDVRQGLAERMAQTAVDP